MSTKDPEWLGTTLTGFRLVERIADGRFSEIYQGENFDGARKERRLFKIAKRAQDVILHSPGAFETNAFEVAGDVSRFVRPNTNQLIGHQHALMTGRLRSEYVRASNISDVDGCWFYTMDDFGNCDFRSIFNDGRATVDTFYFLISVLIRLKQKRGYNYHGDLKPEHLLWTSDQIKLCDQGFFGQIDCYEGELMEVAVTSGAYYPLLQPDDMLAVGLMFWEAVMGFHPLVPNDSNERSTIRKVSIDYGINDGVINIQNDRLSNEIGQVGDSVRDWIKSLGPIGATDIEPFSRLLRPTSIIPDMPPLLENIILKGLRLAIGANGLIEKSDGYKTWDEWLDDTVALSRLSKKERGSVNFLASRPDRVPPE